LSVCSADDLREQMAFIAFHFHWGRDELLTLEHAERRAWCDEISAINRALDGKTQRSLTDI
jgi:hypothetical protein